MKFSFGNQLLRAAVLLGFLPGLTAILVTQGISPGRAATSEPPSIASKARTGAVLPGVTNQSDPLSFDGADSMLNPLESAPPEEFGVALEDDDSIEMFRVDVEQRTFGFDRGVTGPKVALKAVRNIPPSISPPLLV
jgi:hypothetical protein